MTRRRRRVRRRAGFTLMEVLLVLAILVILGSMVTFFFRNTQQRAMSKAARIQIGAFEGALEQYLNDNFVYPNTSQGLVALRTAPSDLRNANKWGGPYLKKDIPPDPWGNPYQYESANGEFRIWSWGPDQANGTEDDVSSDQ